MNLDRARSDDDSKIKEQLSTITDVTAVDEHTVKIAIDGKPGLILGMLTSRAGMIASPAAIEAGTLHTQPDGIGAYQAVDIKLGDEVRFERTPDYWDPDAQRVAAMTYYYMPQSQTAVNALLSGQVQIAHIEPDQIGDVDPNETPVIAGGFSAMQFIEFNTAEEPFDDPNVRLALNLAIDRQGIADGLNDGLCEVPIQPWPSSSIAYDEEIGDGAEVWPYDPQKATELLAEAGYPDGFTFDAITSTVSYYAKLSEVIQSISKTSA
ncbi:ABC transporter substrate-binding protein [Cumulibacter soli]|uniref:ABC transporter substrate-binding protein n=1 Tax=Cumulibacter soli TaxID=2546344 RepID=UPI001FBA4EBF|nr:ABC transporter substrate-binding protein [Cumulibacter soli]